MQSTLNSVNSIDSFVEITVDRMKKVVAEMTKENVCILCSPPGSGKTMFAKKIQEWLSINKNRRVIYIPMCELAYQGSGHSTNIGRNSVDINVFDEFWAKHTGKTWSSCINEDDPMDILIDNVYVIGNQMVFFWNNLKELATEGGNKRILMLSRSELRNMATASSIGFQKHFGLEHLRLTKTEYISLASKYVVRYPFLSFIFDGDQDFIYNSTHGHAGLISSFFRYFIEECSDGGTRNLFLTLISREYKRFIANSTIYSMIRNWSLNDKEIKFLLEILCLLDNDSRFSADPEDDKKLMVDKFIDYGLIVEINGQLELVAPIMRNELWKLAKTNSVF
ncbi:hypothetical protein C1646_766237 [Rhizophagus diaphanus]|nr:hypothetical protein C1646_766237 [Rhizophagus diaphanus] [Rhizophagus sp. MUCL 43196]